MHRGAGDPGRASTPVLVAGSLVCAVILAAGVVIGLRATHHTPAATRPGVTTTTLPATTTTLPVPFAVVTTAPAPNAKAVAYRSAISVQFSAPIAPGSPDPTLTPPVVGTWTHPDPSTLLFRPDGHLVPYSTIHLFIPGGRNGVRDTAGSALPTSYTAAFTVEGASELRLQQLLAELGYLPLSFVPGSTEASQGIASDTTNPSAVTGATGPSAATGPSSPSSVGPATTTTVPPPIDAEPTDPNMISLDPVPGTFAWRYPNVPSNLAALWTPGMWNVITKGAVMAFEINHGLFDDGIAGPQVWRDMLMAVAQRQVTKQPYNFVEVSTHNPETLYVWQNGRIVYQTVANTGGAEAPTAPGIFTVYSRFVTTTMSGRNPNGTHYDDPGIPDVAYFNGGDAIHGFLRAQYGSPQSLGCVELPYTSAAIVFSYDQIGTLVDIF